MEDLIRFNQSIELSPDAKKLMLGMIRSMQSLVPSGPVLVPEDTSEYNSGFMHFFTAEVLKLSRDNEDVFDGIIDTGILEKYITNTDNLKEIGDQLEKLLNDIRKFQHLSGYHSHKLACMMKDHLAMSLPDVCRSLDQDLSEINQDMALKRPAKQANNKLKIV